MIAKTKTDKDDHFEWDTKLPGFALRTRKGKKGVAKTWVVQYRVNNITRRISKNTSVLDPAKAKAWAKSILAEVAMGKDPQGELKAARAADTFKDIASQFIERKKSKKGREWRANTVKGHKLSLLTHCKDLHGLKPAQIGRGQVSAVLRSISKASGPSSADRARASLSACFAWAIGEGNLCPEDYRNPVEGTNQQTSADHEERGRALSDAELAEIWRKAGDDTFGRIVKLLILTGCRRTEIAGLQWDEVGDDGLLISGDRIKNHLPFSVPLPVIALDLIGERPEGKKFVFGRYDSTDGFSGFSKAKAKLDKRLEGVEAWRLNDLRHTFSTGMSSLVETQGKNKGAPLVDPHIVEACLKHVSGAAKAGIAGRYNHSRYDVPKRKAIEQWADHISLITGVVFVAAKKAPARRRNTPWRGKD